jgi:hypothetical protein
LISHLRPERSGSLTRSGVSIFEEKAMTGMKEPKIRVGLVEKIRHKIARILRGDDYDWGEYHNHYATEFAGASPNYSVEIGEFEITNGRLIRPSGAQPLHPNIELFFKVVLELDPKSVLEIGPEWGHQLIMINRVIGADVYGIDISQHQLDSAVELFPELSGNLEVGDVTKPLARKADLVYANAVTMHLGHARMYQAVSNMIDAAGRAVILIENWTSHDYQAFCEDKGLNYEWVEDYGAKGLLIHTDS